MPLRDIITNHINWTQIFLCILFSHSPDVDLGVDPPVWIPATDFTQVIPKIGEPVFYRPSFNPIAQVFTFRDLRDQPEGLGGVDGVWQLLEEQANHPWDYGAGTYLHIHF